MPIWRSLGKNGLKLKKTCGKTTKNLDLLRRKNGHDKTKEAEKNFSRFQPNFEWRDWRVKNDKGYEILRELTKIRLPILAAARRGSSIINGFTELPILAGLV